MVPASRLDEGCSAHGVSACHAARKHDERRFVGCAAGAITTDTAKLFGLGVPVVVAGTWLGLRFYGRVKEEGFRRVVLSLLLLSGASLMVSILTRA
jgi:hypothetical protein